MKTLKSGRRILPAIGVMLIGLLVFSSPYGFQAAFADSVKAVGRPQVTTPIKKAVLLLFSYQADLPAAKLAMQGIQAELGNASDLALDMYYEYMDLNRFGTDGYESQLVTWYTAKYRTRALDLLIISSQAALDFWLKHRAEIAPQTPVVVYDIEPDQLAAHQLPPDVTGVAATADHAQSVNWLLAARPSILEVIVIHGVGPADQEFIQPVEQLKSRANRPVHWSDWSNLPLAEIKQRAAVLPSTAVILYELMFEDAAGIKYRPIDTLRELAAVSSVPILSGYDPLIGTGTIGGYMYSLEEQGRAAASIGLRILRGEAANAIPVSTTQGNHFVFDHPALQRYGIPLTSLPPDSLVKNRQSSFWETYQPQIIATFISFLVLLALVVFLILVTRRLTTARLALSRLNAHLEDQVHERTAALSQTNHDLELQITERQLAEESLRASEERLREVLENSLDASYKRNLVTNTYEYLSPVFARLSGYPPDEMATSPIEIVLEVMHPDDRAEVDRVVAESKSGVTGAAYQVDYRYKHKTGEYRWFHDQFTVIHDAAGQPVALIGSVSDITERKRVEAALRKSEANLRAIFEYSPQSFMLLDRERCVQAYNPIANERTQLIYGHEVQPGDSIYTLMSPAERASFDQNFERVLAGESIRFERSFSPGGQLLWYEYHVAPVRAEEGQVISAFLSVTDVTERKQIEQAEREQRELAEALRDTARALNSTLDFDGVIQEILRNVGRVVPIDSANIALLDSHRKLHYAHFHGYAEHPIDSADLDKVSVSVDVSPIFKTVYDTGEPLIISDTHANPNWIVVPSGTWIRSYAVMPIRVKGDVVGFLNLDSAVLGMYTPQHLDRLRAFADQAALAIENARLYAQAQQELTERIRTETELRRLTEFNESIIETMTEGIIIQDLQGRFRYANPATTVLLGYTREELLGRHWQTIIPAEQWSFAEAADQRRSNGEADRYELDVIRKSGERHTVLVSGSPWYEDGVFAGSLVTFADITERKRAVEALRESQSLYHSLVEVSPLCICRKDLAGRFTFANQRFLEESKITLAELVGKDDFDLHPPDLAEKYRRDDQAVIASEQVRELIEERALVNGEAVIVQSIKTPIRDGAGQIKGIQISFWDITARQRAEEALREWNTTLEQRVAERTTELQAANLRLTELDHLKDEFLSRISHELRTPLTSIKIYLELLETAKPEKREKYVQTLKHEANRLHILIEDVLMFSQLNLYTQPSALESIDLNNLIEGRLTTWQNLSAEHGLAFQLNLAQDLPRTLTDGELILQALNRLIANAVNYTPAGTVTVSTAHTDKHDQPGVTVSVKDTGLGITPDDLPHIFERFYRGRAAADYKTPGVGVGLSISREIAEKLGGRLTVETQVGVGSTFTLWLPSA